MGDFLNLIKESNYNLLEIYKQAPNESLIIVAVLLFLIALAYFFINSSIKKSKLLKELEKIDDIKTLEQLNSKLQYFIDEIPKRGEEPVSLLVKNKDKFFLKTLKILNTFTIKEKVENFLSVSEKYELLSKSISKYKNEKLIQFFKDKSSDLANLLLNKEIENYINEIDFNENEIENINKIVEFANTQNSPSLVLNPIFASLSRYSFSYNLEFFKFIEKLDENSSKQVYDFCKEKIESLFKDSKAQISINILEYIYTNDKKRVYNYIRNLSNSLYLQELYYELFNKKDDLDLDLAFIANPTNIENDYKYYIDNSLTTNWKDKEHINYVSKADGVLDVLGHVEFRSLIERVDRIETDLENNKKIDEALMIAKRAESIALEAKSYNQTISEREKNRNKG